MARARMLQGGDLARAAMLRDEGMPASWIAEDLDCRRESLFRSGVTAPPALAAEWRQVWAQIRTNPTLYALHRDLQPTAEYRV